MKKIIVLAVAFTALTGCATTAMNARLDQLAQDNDNLRRQNAALMRQQQAETRHDDLQAGAKVTVTQQPAPGASEIDPSQPVMNVSNVATFAESNPGAFQCFMDRNPGFGGEWIKIPNKTTRRWIALRLNSQPVIVLRPTPGGWQPYYARPDVTVLPPGKSCYVWVPQGRMRPDGELESYQIEADAYFPSYSNGWRVLLAEKRNSYFPYDESTRYLSQFNLDSRGITVYPFLEDPAFK